MSLNDEVWCFLAPSSIHGVGVFALRDIPKGQRLYCQSVRQYLRFDPIDNLLPEIQELIKARWPDYEVNGYISPNDDARLISFMNHSATPNYDPKTDTALENIKKGEEVLETYSVLVPNSI